jgi:alanine dehydrogenase
MDANVTILDTNLDRLRFWSTCFGRLTTVASNSYNIAEAVQAPIWSSAVLLIKGARAAWSTRDDLDHEPGQRCRRRGRRQEGV